MASNAARSLLPLAHSDIGPVASISSCNLTFSSATWSWDSVEWIVSSLELPTCHRTTITSITAERLIAESSRTASPSLVLRLLWARALPLIWPLHSCDGQSGLLQLSASWNSAFHSAAGHAELPVSLSFECFCLFHLAGMAAQGFGRWVRIHVWSPLHDTLEVRSLWPVS